MRMEWWILLFVYLTAIGIVCFIPKSKIRLGVAAFLFNQVLTFSIGTAVVELGLLEYPVRLFSSINRTSFTFEFFAFPVTCAAFNAWYPGGKHVPAQLGYYVGFTSVMTILEVLIEKYTDLIKYIHWEWYISWITIALALFIVRLYCNWFFAKGKLHV
jgi:hypothetical protein